MMEEIECKPPTQLIVEASISSTDHPKKNNNGEALSPSCSNILTKIHAGYFRISLSLGCQALLWKILTQPNGVSRDVLHVFSKLPSTACLLLWCLAALTQISLTLVYVLRCYFQFDLVKAEFSHHIGVNYLYAPWISWLALLQSAPILLQNSSLLYMILCWTFIVPLAMLDIKIYGQWFTTEKRFLSVMANPTSLISVIGNLVAARAAAQMGWKESAVCMWSLGMVHYLVLFVTLYQRLSGQNSLPTILRPTFFLFFAAPSMGSLAWNSITGTFDTTSKMLFFFSLFLSVSLACRPFLFKKSMRKFNVAWWAYSFPLTFLAMAAVEYSREVKCHVATLLMLLLSVVSVLVFLGLMMLTAANIDRLLGGTDDPILAFCKNKKSNAGATTK
ncbi:hypothetical protein Gogos_005020 [Gossypium gossypioides]|uniref:S-type anion channel SLAH4-like n=1 Tax=Gossypium gossypioides TaxID=34282 RepID=A0A7J9CI48_GOSGO|nr:hypothetical protein [Gossypium gossypioides]